MAAKKRKMAKRDKLLIVAVISIICYSIAAIVLQFCTLIELSSTLTQCWYGFWTIEVWLISGITKTKIKNQYYNQAGMPESEDRE